MLKAVLLKELRENALIAAVALVAYLGLAGTTMGLPVLPFLSGSGWREIPFVGTTFPSFFTVMAVAAAAALGFHQSLGDSWGSVYLFLLHRPLSRRDLLRNKLLVGLVLYLATSAVPIVVLAAWAAAPGTHASPFEWSMTWLSWRLWLVISLVYLGAFLSGIRPANWFGSRLAPLAAAGLLTTVAAGFPNVAVGLALWLMGSLLVTSLILAEGDARDFS